MNKIIVHVLYVKEEMVVADGNLAVGFNYLKLKRLPLRDSLFISELIFL
jgi:hypothetical protein